MIDPIEKHKSITNLIHLFDHALCYEIGPKLSCNECEIFCKFFEAHGEVNVAQTLRIAHSIHDVRGDMPSHLKIKRQEEWGDAEEEE